MVLTGQESFSSILDITSDSLSVTQVLIRILASIVAFGDGRCDIPEFYLRLDHSLLGLVELQFWWDLSGLLLDIKALTLDASLLHLLLLVCWHAVAIVRHYLGVSGTRHDRVRSVSYCL